MLCPLAKSLRVQLCAKLRRSMEIVAGLSDALDYLLRSYPTIPIPAGPALSCPLAQRKYCPQRTVAWLVLLRVADVLRRKCSRLGVPIINLGSRGTVGLRFVVLR